MGKSEYSKVNFPELRRFKKMFKNDIGYYTDVIDKSMEYQMKHFSGQGCFHVLLIDRFVYHRGISYYINSKELVDFLINAEIKITIDEIKKIIRKNITQVKRQPGSMAESFIGNIFTKNFNNTFHFDFEIFNSEYLGGEDEETHLTFSDGDSFSHISFTENAINDINKKRMIEIKDKNDPIFNMNKDEIREKIKEQKLSEDIHYVTNGYKLILNLLFYMSAFPENVLDTPPDEVCDKLNKNNSKTISLSKEIADYIHENRDVSPHLRRGHFRMLSSDYFKNKQGQIVFVKSSFVKGNAKTVIE